MISISKIMALNINEEYFVDTRSLVYMNLFSTIENGETLYSWHMRTNYIPYNNWPSKYKPVNSTDYQIQFFKTLNGAKRNLIRYLKRYWDGEIQEENVMEKIKSKIKSSRSLKI